MALNNLIRAARCVLVDLMCCVVFMRHLLVR